MKTGSDFENGQRIGKKIANRIWRSVTSEYLEKLYESMPKRMLAVMVLFSQKFNFFVRRLYSFGLGGIVIEIEKTT